MSLISPNFNVKSIIFFPNFDQEPFPKIARKGPGFRIVFIKGSGFAVVYLFYIVAPIACRVCVMFSFCFAMVTPFYFYNQSADKRRPDCFTFIVI